LARAVWFDSALNVTEGTSSFVVFWVVWDGVEAVKGVGVDGASRLVRNVFCVLVWLADAERKRVFRTDTVAGFCTCTDGVLSLTIVASYSGGEGCAEGGGDVDSRLSCDSSEDDDEEVDVVLLSLKADQAIVMGVGDEMCPIILGGTIGVAAAGIKVSPPLETEEREDTPLPSEVCPLVVEVSSGAEAEPLAPISAIRLCWLIIA